MCSERHTTSNPPGKGCPNCRPQGGPSHLHDPGPRPIPEQRAPLRRRGVPNCAAGQVGWAKQPGFPLARPSRLLLRLSSLSLETASREAADLLVPGSRSAEWAVCSKACLEIDSESYCSGSTRKVRTARSREKNPERSREHKLARF